MVVMEERRKHDDEVQGLGLMMGQLVGFWGLMQLRGDELVLQMLLDVLELLLLMRAPWRLRVE